MTGFNLPPGVNVSDIPGNRPEDEREDAFWEALDQRFAAKHGPDALEEINELLETITIGHFLAEYVRMASGLGYEEGWQEQRQESQVEDVEASSEAIERGLLTYEETAKHDRALREVRKSWRSDHP